MAKFPVDYGDPVGEVDAINYLLSGPQSLGQYFSGVSSSTTAYLTGNDREPFTNPDNTTQTYVAPISLTSSEYLDARTIKFTFAAAQATPPFALGNNVEVTGSAAPLVYDQVYRGAGVVYCSTTYAIVRVDGDGTVPALAAGGTIGYSAVLYPAGAKTDCSGYAQVTGGTDRVFISAQLNNVLHYTCTAGSSIAYTVQITRYLGSANNDPYNPATKFDFDAAIASRTYYYQMDPGSGTIPPPFNDIIAGYFELGTGTIETIFTSIIDSPPVGYYWYVLTISVEQLSGDVVITQSELSNRSLTAQVVKQ